MCYYSQRYGCSMQYFMENVLYRRIEKRPQVGRKVQKNVIFTMLDIKVLTKLLDILLMVINTTLSSIDKKEGRNFYLLLNKT
jgi:hypothetical protein